MAARRPQLTSLGAIARADLRGHWVDLAGAAQTLALVFSRALHGLREGARLAARIDVTAALPHITGTQPSAAPHQFGTSRRIL